MKSISKFSLGYPKSNFLSGVLGFSGPIAQKVINEQAEFERKAANDQIVFENKQIAFDSMQARLKKTELDEQGQIWRTKTLKVLLEILLIKMFEGYTEVFNIILEAIKKSL